MVSSLETLPEAESLLLNFDTNSGYSTMITGSITL